MSPTAVPLASDGFTAVRIEGSVLSPEILARISAGDRTLPGMTPGEYSLPVGRLGDAVSRSWAYLQGVYQSYRDQLKHLPAADLGTTLTRRKWLLPLFAELGYGQLATTPRGVTAGGRSFPVSHLHREHFPVHLLSWHAELDRRPAKGGRVPQAMLQDCLNTGGSLLWGVLSNGRVLRLVRDSTSLVGSAYIEFDLESIFDGDLYADFYLLYALLHASRIDLLPREDDAPGDPTAADCWLERWREEALESGSRFLRGLSTGLQLALEELGAGFLAHPANEQLGKGLRSGDVPKDRLNAALLRLVYRLIFLFVAEDRQALFGKDTDTQARDRYETYFSSSRLRRLALTMKGDRRDDLWQALVMVLTALGKEGGDPRLALPGLGGVYDPDPQDHLFDDVTLASLRLPNDRLLAAVRHLSRVRSDDGSRWLPVDYRHLGAEELGGVYEGLLELVPDPDPDRKTYRLRNSAGHSRKASGSYYTPTALVDTLLESALDPVLEEAAKSSNPVDALLRVTVCDPACGSGHFLVAAARRIAKRIAVVHTQETEPPVDAVQRWLPDVVARCIHGVDLDRMAVDLAKFALWMQALEPGKPRPMSFLDAHVRQGNALLGATPRLLEQGIPDVAYQALEGDDAKQVARLRKRNREERDAGQDALFSTGGVTVATGNAHHAHVLADIHRKPGRELADIHRQIDKYRSWQSSPEKLRDRRIADAWCAAFVWPTYIGGPEGIAGDSWRRLIENGSAGAVTDQTVDRLAHEYGFFHWHLEFPHIFNSSDDEAPGYDPDLGWSGGFSCVLGNPPWDRVKLQDKEFFATRVPEIAAASNKAARDRAIAKLAASEEQRFHYDAYLAARRRSEGTLHLLRDSGRFPLTGQGDVNTYSVFAETARQFVAGRGRMGIIVPTGIAVDSTTAPFFRDILQQRRLDSLLDFVTNPRIWTDVGNRRYRFSLLTVTGRETEVMQAESWTLGKHPDELPPRGERIQVNPADLLLVNPNTGTMPMFRTQRDADITLGIYRRVPVLWDENSDAPEANPWGISFMTMFHMAGDSDMFWEQPELEAGGLRLEGNVFTDGAHRLLPLYEAKFVHHYDHRLSCYSKRPEGSQDTELPRLTLEEKNDPGRGPIPRYWMSECDVEHRLKGRWDKRWLLGWRDITNATNERTVLASVLPRAAVGHTAPLMFPTRGDVAGLLANLGSFVFDFTVRQKVSGVHLTFGNFRQLPVLGPAQYERPTSWDAEANLNAWITPRILELTYTAHDLTPFARDLGDEGAPFRWDEARRAQIRAELDAAMFHLYGLTEAQVDHVMETFPIVRGKDMSAYGEYRTKRLIIEAYTAMDKAAQAGAAYVSPLNPPPGHGPRHAVA